MNGQVNSLNASVAAAIVIYEAVRQRSVCQPLLKRINSPVRDRKKGDLKMSKQYDVDDILNEIKAKKARQNASPVCPRRTRLSRRPSQTGQRKHRGPFLPSIPAASTGACDPTKTNRSAATGSTGCFIRSRAHRSRLPAPQSNRRAQPNTMI